MDVMHEGLLSTKKLDDKSEQLLRKLFDVTAAIKPIGDDDLKVLWVQVKRPSLTQYRAYYKDRTTPHDEMKSRYLEEYPTKCAGINCAWSGMEKEMMSSSEDS